MRISLIVAMSQNRVIGRNGELPWHLPADLRRFKKLTMGHAIIMGRKTYESIGRALPGRRSIVITRQTDFAAPSVLVAHSIPEAFELARGDDEVFVIGGQQIFHEALPHADRIYMTQVLAEISGDVFFPDFDESVWKVVERTDHSQDEKNRLDYRFLTYDRLPNQDPERKVIRDEPFRSGIA